jgi:tetratricopeptide (TPR) repeat protein
VLRLADIRLWAFFLAPVALFSGLAAGQNRSAADSAYSILSTNPDGAARLFRVALAQDPSNVTLHRQLGYLSLSRDESEEALEEFTLSDKYLPSDTIKLQRAYILVSLGRTGEARTLFEEVANSPLPALSEKGRAELAALSTAPEIPRHWTHVYGAVYYDTRWSTLFYQGHVQHGYDLTADHRWSLYGKASISGDNKSRGVGLAPLVISDNTLLLAVGVRVKPFAGLMIDVQEGLAIDLLDKGAGTTSRGDFRAVANYGAGIYAPFTVHDRLEFPLQPFADVYASAGYYSRYRNGIAYAQARAGLHAVEVSRTSLDVYARLDLVRDTEELFYNNLVEIGGGVRLTPNVEWGLYLIGEYHRGFYWDVSTAATQERALLYSAAYNSVRLFVIFDKMF